MPNWPTAKSISRRTCRWATVSTPFLPLDLAGAWETKITTPDGNEFTLKYDLKLDGQKLSGTVEGPLGVLNIEDGKMNGDSISYKIKINDNDVSYEGKIADGKINVKSHGGPFGDREYKLTRPIADVSGKWGGHL